jgi:ferrochelatase
MMGGRSPILPQTVAQSLALEELLQADGAFRVFNVMRHWHPFAAPVMEEVKNFAPDKVILLPLYPQFSSSTTASSINDWRVKATKLALQAEEISVCCYPTNPGFIDAYVELIIPILATASQYGKARLLFSAHGLPMKNIKAGDPYQWQVEQSVAAIVAKLNITDLDYKLCYQSKVGPLEWLKPSTEHEIIEAAKSKLPVVIVPIAFVSEHSETLVELDIEYKELALEHGLSAYFRVPTVTTHPKFIQGLKDLCLNALADSKNACPKTCPAACKQCFCRQG